MSNVVVMECPDYSLDNLVHTLSASIPYQAGKILVSEDPLALDAVAAKMVGMNIEHVPILETAQKRNLGEGRLKHISLAGDYDQIPRLAKFKLPKRFGTTKKRNSKALLKVIDFFSTRPKVNQSKCRKCNMCGKLSCTSDRQRDKTDRLFRLY